MNIWRMALAPSIIQNGTCEKLLNWCVIVELKICVRGFIISIEVVYHLCLRRKAFLFLAYLKIEDCLITWYPFLDRRIVPGNSYNSTFIQDAIISVTGRRPCLYCLRIGRDVQLYEIRFAWSNFPGQINCPFRSGCGNSVLFPLARPLRPWHGP